MGGGWGPRPKNHPLDTPHTHTHTLSQPQKLCRHGCCCQGDCPKCKGGVGAAGVLLAFASSRRRKQYVSKKSRRVNKPRERVCRLSMMSKVSLPVDQSNFLLAVLMIDWKAMSGTRPPSHSNRNVWWTLNVAGVSAAEAVLLSVALRAAPFLHWINQGHAAPVALGAVIQSRQSEGWIPPGLVSPWKECQICLAFKQVQRFDFQPETCQEF